MEIKNDNQSTIKAGVFNLISNILSMIVSLVTLSLLSYLMPPADLGIATSFVTLQTILSYVIYGAIFTSINKIILNKDINFDEYLSTISLFSIFSTCFFFLLYFLFHIQINNIFGFSTVLFTFMFLTTLFENAFLVMYTKWTFLNKYIKIFVYNLLTSVFPQLLSLLFVFLMTHNLYWGRILGIKLLPFIAGIICLLYMLIKGKFRFNFYYLQQGLLLSIPIIAHLLSQVLLANSDLLMIKSLIDSTSAGIYSIAYTVSNVLLTTILCVLKPWSPWVYRRLNENNIDPIYNNSKWIIILFFVLSIGLITIAPEMIEFFLSNSYASSVYLIAPLTLGMYFQGIYVLFYDVEFFYSKGKNIAIYSVLAAFFNIVTNYMFITQYGYQMAAYTTFASYLLLTIFHYVGMKKADRRQIYDIKSTIIYSIALILYAILYMVMIDNIIVRYLMFILTMLIVLIFERNNIIKLLKYFFRK